MAKCDKGYLCKVCSLPVDLITDSDLYLRYILHEVKPEVLHLEPDCHIRCNPERAQYILDLNFESVTIEGPFSKSFLDTVFVSEEEQRVTNAWKKLAHLVALGIPIIDYPQS